MGLDTHEKDLPWREAVIAKAQPRRDRLPAYLALLGGIVCIAWSAIFVRWTDIPGPASASIRHANPRRRASSNVFLRPNTPVLDLRTLGIIAFGGLFFAFDLASTNTPFCKPPTQRALLGNHTPIRRSSPGWSSVNVRQRLLVRPPHGHRWRGRNSMGRLAHHTRSAWETCKPSPPPPVSLSTHGDGKRFALHRHARILAHAMISSTLAFLLINLAMGISLRVRTAHHRHPRWPYLHSAAIFLTTPLAIFPLRSRPSASSRKAVDRRMAAVLLGEPSASPKSSAASSS